MNHPMLYTFTFSLLVTIAILSIKKQCRNNTIHDLKELYEKIKNCPPEGNRHAIKQYYKLIEISEKHKISIRDIGISNIKDFEKSVMDAFLIYKIYWEFSHLELKKSFDCAVGRCKSEYEPEVVRLREALAKSHASLQQLEYELETFLNSTGLPKKNKK